MKKTGLSPLGRVVKPWAKSSIGEQPLISLESLQWGLTVSLIATPRAKFEICSRDEELAAVIERNRKNSFDFLPVTDGQIGRILGLLEISPYMQAEVPHETVGALMQPLSEENLIGSDASILIFVRNADQHKCQLIVSRHEISGLVSLSDLQRLPVRAALFSLITNLEMVMQEFIRKEYGKGDVWLLHLKDIRRDKLKEEINKATAKDGIVDALLFTQFADKRTIILKCHRFLIDYDRFDSELKAVEKLRNHLAHANDYAASQEAAIETCITVRLIDEWNLRLTQGLR